MTELERRLIGALLLERIAQGKGGTKWTAPCGEVIDVTSFAASESVRQAYDRQFHLIVCEAC